MNNLVHGQHVVVPACDCEADKGKPRANHLPADSVWCCPLCRQEWKVIRKNSSTYVGGGGRMGHFGGIGMGTPISQVGVWRKTGRNVALYQARAIAGRIAEIQSQKQLEEIEAAEEAAAQRVDRAHARARERGGYTLVQKFHGRRARRKPITFYANQELRRQAGKPIHIIPPQDEAAMNEAVEALMGPIEEAERPTPGSTA